MTHRIATLIALLGLLASGIVGAEEAVSWAEACVKGLAGQKGAVVAISLPSGTLLHVENRPLAEKKFGGTSVYKPLATYALLKEKAVTPDALFKTSKTVKVERYGVSVYSRYDKPGMEISLARALADSNNGYFYVHGAKLSVETWLRYYREFGLGGCIRPPATDRERAELPAHGGGCISASALDLVPYLTKLAVDASPEMAEVRKGMLLCVQGGTGRKVQAKGLSVCGKTGWFNGIGQFLAFAPCEKPEVGLIVTIPGATGGDAAEVAGRLLAIWERNPQL